MSKSELSLNLSYPPPSNRFSTLPDIGRTNLPTKAIPTDEDNQLVPLMDTTGNRRSYVSTDPDDRFRHLETRLNVAEKSNRALLDEVVRLQSELKSVSRRGEDALREERKARQYLENSLTSSNDLVGQLAQRLRQQEDKISEERSALDQVLNQAKTMEQQVKGTQQELNNKKQTHMTRIGALERDLETMTRAKNQLERISYQLVEEMRSLKMKLESQGMDFSTVATDIKAKNRRLEDDYQTRYDDLKRKLEKAADADEISSQLKSQVEQRLNELRELIVDLRGKSEHEASERQSLEQKVSTRINELARSLGEQNRKREESFHNIDVRQRERDRQLESERMLLQTKIQEAVEELNQRILEKEIKLREEAAKRQMESEKMILQEQESRIIYEKESRAEQERRWDTMRKLHDEEMSAVKVIQKQDRNKMNESLRKLDDSIVILEKQLEESRKDLNKVLGAEIASRKTREREHKARFHELEEKISAATSALQQAISGLSGQINSMHEKSRKTMGELLDDYRKENLRKLNDVDAQIASLQARFGTLDDKVDAKIAADKEAIASATALAQNLREKVESISLWQTQANSQMHELNISNKTTLEAASRNSERIEILRNEVKAGIGAEIHGRVQDIDSVRRDLQLLRDQMPKDEGVTKKDLEECQASVRRLAEIAQTVKTVLGMKIQSEQKLRVEEIKLVHDDVAQLRNLIEPLIERLMEPKIFVKPDNWQIEGREVAEQDSEDINRWSLYSTYKWMQYKQKWMYLKWAASNREAQ